MILCVIFVVWPIGKYAFHSKPLSNSENYDWYLFFFWLYCFNTTNFVYTFVCFCIFIYQMIFAGKKMVGFSMNYLFDVVFGFVQNLVKENWSIIIIWNCCLILSSLNVYIYKYNYLFHNHYQCFFRIWFISSRFIELITPSFKI